MRYLRVALEPDGAEIHPLFPVFTDSAFVNRAQMLDWNVPPGEDTSTCLFYVSGDEARVSDVLKDLDITEHHDITTISTDEFYVYIMAETTDIERKIWRALTLDSLLLMPPLDYSDGQVRFNLIGTHEELQEAIEALPETVQADVRRIAEYDQHTETIASVLSDRQFEAVMAGFEAGYYNVPREATKEDIAERLDCSPSTASEHLRKAESRIISTFLGDE